MLPRVLRITPFATVCEPCTLLFPMFLLAEKNSPYRNSCSECATGCGTRKALLEHMKSAHPEVSFPCRSCNYTAKLRSQLEKWAGAWWFAFTSSSPFKDSCSVTTRSQFLCRHVGQFKLCVDALISQQAHASATWQRQLDPLLWDVRPYL